MFASAPVVVTPPPTCVIPVPTSNELASLILKNKVDVIGFSDHTLDNLSSLIAVSMGAKIIEKHFTLDKGLPGPDQQLSADPKVLRHLRKTIEKALLVLGDGEQPFDEELQSDYYGKRSLYSLGSKMIDQRPRQSSQPPVNKLTKIINPD